MKPAIALFDLDGVLADFVGGALRHFGSQLPPDRVQWGFPTQLGFSSTNDPEFWAPLGREFWAGLAPHTDGFFLLREAERLVGPERIALLSSPCGTAGCADGKRDWVAKHLPDYGKRLFLGSTKHLFAGSRVVLVDDYDANVDAFRQAGGIAVQPPRPWNDRAPECHAGGTFDVVNTLEEVRKAIMRATR